MFNRTKVIDNLIGLVGWRQPANPDYNTLNADNLQSDSGRIFNSNAFVKPELLKDTDDYDEADDSDVNDSLLNLQKTAITNVMDSVFNEVDYIDRQVLYQNSNNKINTETLPNGFVGYRIYQNLDKTQAFEITRCLLEFKNVDSDITLAIYSAAKSEPLFTKDITVTSEQQSVELNWRLDNTDDFYKGEYYFGYLTDSVTLQPIKRDYQSADIMSCITGMSLEPIQVEYTPTSNELFDLDDIDSTSECWGLNPDITVFDDFTDIILQNKFLFSYAIELQGQIKAIERYMATIRSNANERIAADYYNKILIELDGINTENIRRKGLRAILISEIANVKTEIKKLKNGYFADGFLLNTLS